jgi:hypothetical protein
MYFLRSQHTNIKKKDMNINKVNTAKKIGDFLVRHDGSPHKIDLKYLPSIQRDFLSDDSARIYLFVVDGIIKKIGGSASKGGIKATMSFYINALAGSPGVPRFVLHLLIHRALMANSKVELFMITSEKTLARVSGLFGSKEMEIASFKEMEDLCKADYFASEKKYPDWNFQENSTDYPNDLAKLHNEYHNERLKKKEQG